MNPSRIDRIAGAIFQANLERRRFEPLAGDDFPLSMDEASRIQDAVYALCAILTDRCWCAGIVLGAGVQRDPVPVPDGLAVSLPWNGEIESLGEKTVTVD